MWLFWIPNIINSSGKGSYVRKLHHSMTSSQCPAGWDWGCTSGAGSCSSIHFPTLSASRRPLIHQRTAACGLGSEPSQPPASSAQSWDVAPAGLWRAQVSNPQERGPRVRRAPGLDFLLWGPFPSWKLLCSWQNVSQWTSSTLDTCSSLGFLRRRVEKRLKGTLPSTNKHKVFLTVTALYLRVGCAAMIFVVSVD